MLCAVHSPSFDVAGLALASTVSSTVSALLLLLPMGKRYPGLLTRMFWFDIIRMTFCAVLMGFAVTATRTVLTGFLADDIIGRTLIVLLPTIIGLTLYFLFAHLTAIPEMKQCMQMVRKLGRRS